MKKVLVFLFGITISYAQEKDTLKGVVVKEKNRMVCHSCCENTKEPLYVVNDKVTSLKDLEKIDTQKVTNIEILKNEKAIKKFGKKGENGVIMITTK